MTAATGVRLFAILARQAPVGVVFRRGPSKQVLLIKWDLTRDRFELGQWFKGRIYERRCDLSPSGERLIYFAAKFKGPVYSWTAVSRPPYLTALALWPKGDTWNGGGLFQSENAILLDQVPAVPAEGEIPSWITVRSLLAPMGEDAPVYHRRLLRDGWVLRHEGVQHSGERGWTYDPPTVYARQAQIAHRSLRLEMRTVGIGHTPGDPWYEIDHRVMEGENVILDLGRTDWADWDFQSDLLFAREGRLYRLTHAHLAAPTCTVAEAVLLADFRDHRFEEKPPPHRALRW